MENKIRCIAIDDEPMALEVLLDYINEVPYFEMLGSFNDAFKALDFLSSQKVDLIFLDIKMPDLSGIQFIEKLEERKLIILTTAYSEYALQSYDFDAVDYLLKPIALERFIKASKKALNIWSSGALVSNSSQAEVDFTIKIKSGHVTHSIYTGNLLYIEGNGNYLNFQLKEKKILSLMKMDEALRILPKHFLRIHKSYIVNTHQISMSSSKYLIIGGQKLPISKTYKGNIQKINR